MPTEQPANNAQPGDAPLLAIVRRMIDQRELSTGAPHRPIFHSNDVEMRDGRPVFLNRERAERLVANDPSHRMVHHHADFIDTLSRQGFQGQPVSPAARHQANYLLSQAFAAQTECSEVIILATSTGAGSYFRDPELPTLMNNSNVTHIHFMHPSDQQPAPPASPILRVLPKTEWYHWQRQQWVDANCQRLSRITEEHVHQLTAWESGGRQGSRPSTQFAIDDYALEMASIYRNLSDPSPPAYMNRNAKDGSGNWPANSEGHYMQQLQAALDGAPEAIRDRVLSRVRQELQGNNRALSLLEVDFPSPAPAPAAGPQNVTTTSALTPPPVPGRSGQTGAGILSA